MPVFLSPLREKIVVGGAGLAGLTAAYRLKQKGCNVHVYEARKRVGGRVFSVLIKNRGDGFSIGELGAQNLKDGGACHHILSLIDELGLEIIKDSIKYRQFFWDGENIYNPLDLYKNYTVNNLIFENSTFSSMNDVLRVMFEHHPLLERIFKTQLTEFEGSKPSKLSIYHNMKTLKHMVRALDVVSSLNDKRSLSIARILIKGGNAQLPLALKELLSPHVHLEKALCKVKRQNDGFLHLVFADGSQVVCQKLVLAIPSSVYRDIQFDPNLIQLDRLKKIKSVNYGSSAKILMPVKASFDTLASPDTPALITDDMIAWSPNKKLLTLFFGGESGEKLLRNLSVLFQKSVKGLDALKSFVFSSEEEPQPVKDEQFSVYQGAVVKSWAEDFFSRGSYSNFGLELGKDFDTRAEYKGQSVKALFAPMADQIFFAGEHTTILDEIGTMEAAVESGNRVAKQVLAF